METICSTKPEELLLEHVRNNETKKIQELVQNNPGLLEYMYDKPFSFRTIMQIVCRTLSSEVTTQTVETLIKLGADLSKPSVNDKGKQALHFAATSLNESHLKTICNQLKQKEIDVLTYDGDTALLCIVKECDCESKNAIKCIRVLIDYNADINKADYENLSPILHAAMKGYRKVVALLLENSYIDLDTHSYHNKTARDFIISDNLYNKEKIPVRKTASSALWSMMSRFWQKRHEEVSPVLEPDDCHGKPNINIEMEKIHSVCLDPEELLLDYVRNNEITKIEELVRDNQGLLRYEYGKPFHGKTIIQIVCSTLSAEVVPETVETLIKLGADLSQTSAYYFGNRNIHFAASSLNECLLKTICKYIELEEIDDTTLRGDTALLCIIKYCDCESRNALKCIQVLLDHNADANKPDWRDITPILYAAMEGYRKVVALLLEKPNVDIDKHTFLEKTARDLIIENNLYDTERLPPRKAIPSNKCLLLSEIFRALRDGREEDFLKLEGIRDLVNESDDGETMLQICARLNLPRCAKRLVNLGADINKTTLQCIYTPLLIAAKSGSCEVFEELCEDLENFPLFLFLLKFYHNHPTYQTNLRKCIELLLDKNKSLLNRKTTFTPLHFASSYGDKEMTLFLLNKGASLGNADVFGKLPVEDIEIETLRKHFNNCITSSSDNIANIYLLVTFNYKTLIRSEFCSGSANATVEDNVILDWDGQESDPEIDVISPTAKIKKPLLAQPPMEKQKLLGWESEMDVMSHIAQNNKLRPLLTHPLISSFIHIKWRRIRYFFYANLVLYLTTCLSLTLYILLVYNHPNNQEESPSFKTFSNILLVIIKVTSVLFIIKEIFQVVVSPLLYFKQIENLFEIMFIVGMGSILILPEPSDNTKKQISAITILVSAFQLVLLVGHLPKMSTNVVMLRTVSYSFFKLLLWNAILILAFAFSFYTLFSDVTNSTDPFNGIGVSLFKTFMMMTGEFDSSNINFEKFPYTSRALFFVFIFTIVIVLFNLMNGLAVSDTQDIKSNAELFAYKSRVDHIHYIENMLLGNLAFMPSKFFKAPRLPCLNLRITLPKKLSEFASLFPNYLNCFEMDVYLNQDGKIKLPRSKKHVSLDKDTLKNVRTLLKADDSPKMTLETMDDSLQKKLETIDYSLQKKLEAVDSSLQKKFQTVDESLQRKLQNVDNALQKRLEAIEDQQKEMLKSINKILERLDRI